MLILAIMEHYALGRGRLKSRNYEAVMVMANVYDRARKLVALKQQRCSLALLQASLTQGLLSDTSGFSASFL